MEPSAELEINRQLESGESLLWSGQPKQGLVLRGSDALLIPFSILWGGFAIFWEATALMQGAPLSFVLFGIPLVLMGLHFVFGRFLLDSRIRANTFYGLTDRRIILLSGMFSRSTNSLPLRTLSDISVRERSDGRGTILFGRPNPLSSWFGGVQWIGMSQYETPGFDLIENAKQVHDQILEAQRAAV